MMSSHGSVLALSLIMSGAALIAGCQPADDEPATESAATQADDADKAPVAIAAAGDRQQARLVLNHVAGCKDDQHARQHDRCLEVLGHVGIAECPTD